MGISFIGVPEAPDDDKLYGRKNLGWAESTGGSGIPDAPSDGTLYGRKNSAWSPVSSGGGGQVDGAQYVFASDYATGTARPIVPLPFDVIKFDDIGFTTSQSPGVFIVPAGVSRVKLSLTIEIPLGPTIPSGFVATITNSDGSVRFSSDSTFNSVSAVEGYANGQLYCMVILNVNVGDQFAARFNSNFMSTFNLIAAQTQFNIEKLR